MAFLRKYVFLDLYWRVSVKQNFSLIAGLIWKSGPSPYLVDQVFQQKAQRSLKQTFSINTEY